jgi:hypothetical protein
MPRKTSLWRKTPFESENISFEEVTCKSFPNKEEFKIALQLTADLLANLKAEPRLDLGPFYSQRCSVALEDVPSEGVASKSFPNKEEDSETAARKLKGCL